MDKKRISDDWWRQPPMTAPREHRLPEPEVPADANLTTFHSLYLCVDELRQTRQYRLKNPAVRGAFSSLLLRAVHLRPAGSLPNDHRELADLANVNPQAWRRLYEDGALAGWELHADGRLYHPVLTEAVLGALRKQRGGRKGGSTPKMVLPPHLPPY